MRLSKVPGVVWVCLTVAFLGILAAYVYLDASGADGTEFRGFMSIVLNLATLAVAGTGAAAAGQTARQTNGDLDPRLEEAARKAIAAERARDNTLVQEQMHGTTP